MEDSSLLTDWVNEMSCDITLIKQLETSQLLQSSDSFGESRGHSVKKVKVYEHSPFVGVRSAKELENFLWDIEQYFTIARTLEGQRSL